MKRFYEKIGHFLMRYSYSAKIRFTFITNIFCAVLLIGSILFLQSPLISTFEMKLQGISYHRKLNELLRTCCHVEILLTESISQGNVHEILEKLDKDFHENTSNWYAGILAIQDVSPEGAREANLLREKAVEQWKGIQNSIKETQQVPASSIRALTQNILDLINFNFHTYRLGLGVEMQIYLLSYLGMKELPPSQALIASMVVNRRKSQEDPSVDIAITQQEEITALKKLLELMKERVSQYNGMYKLLNENEQEIQISQGFAKYETAVTEYQEKLADKEVSTKAISEYAEETLEKGWQFEEAILNPLKASLRFELKILYFRQYASIILVLFSLLTFFIMFFTRVIRRPLEAVKEAAKSFSEGDLSVRVPITSKDEVATISKTFNKMAAVWGENINKAKQITDQLVEYATKVFDIAKSLDLHIGDQDELIKGIEIKSKEVATTEHYFVELLKEANKNISITSKAAEYGRTSLYEMQNIMQQMVNVSKQIADIFTGFKDKVGNINQVIGKIVSIADQSNLLALNTAIRANRIGFKNTGFAVVAERIRELADQTALTTLDIEDIIKEINSVVLRAATAFNEFTLQIAFQAGDEKNVNELLQERINQTQEQLRTFDKINFDMEEQLKESLKINHSISNLSEVTEETRFSIKKLYADAEYLHQSTQALRKMLEAFHE